MLRHAVQDDTSQGDITGGFTLIERTTDYHRSASSSHPGWSTSADVSRLLWDSETSSPLAEPAGIARSLPFRAPQAGFGRLKPAVPGLWVAQALACRIASAHSAVLEGPAANRRTGCGQKAPGFLDTRTTILSFGSEQSP